MGLLLRQLFLHHPRFLCLLPFHSGTEDTAGDRHAAHSQLYPLHSYVPVRGHGGEDIGGLYKEPRSTDRQVFSRRTTPTGKEVGPGPRGPELPWEGR